MRRPVLLATTMLVLLLAFWTVPRNHGVEAAPAGATTGQAVVSQTCLTSGLVQATFRWNSSGLGAQWVDVSASPVFNGFANFGPLPSYVNTLQWTNLLPGTAYYSRVSTWVGFWLTTDPIAFVTPSCPGAFTPPSSPISAVLGPTSVLFQWNRGAEEPQRVHQCFRCCRYTDCNVQLGRTHSYDLLLRRLRRELV